MEQGQLGALLLQFPWSLKNTAENRSYVVGLHRRFREFPLVLEVRHDTWAIPETLELLAELDMGLCNIDQPLFERSIKPGSEATSRLGYVRLHGRNYNKWFSPHALSHERYDYLYAPKELEPWVERIEAISRKTKDTYAMSNNHHVGKAITNSLEINSLLTSKLISHRRPYWSATPSLETSRKERGSCWADLVEHHSRDSPPLHCRAKMHEDNADAESRLHKSSSA